MSVLFNFHSFLTVVLFVICAYTYIKMQFPKILQEKTGNHIKQKACMDILANVLRKLWVAIACSLAGFEVSSGKRPE
ncbi:hypothetical protein GIB67_028851 [Kingdonia uniflora]|uniref:Protein kish n=1 Tax=Kingdonia uniflora TaxID=39325 RepID=A0A7J7LT58_9MAGN|nr:hypothetical protein GIB67_028851 [Kingdonia uniflora]